MARGMSQASQGLSMAFGFVIVVLVFWFAGRGLDAWLNSEPWFQIVGAVVGWALGVVTVYYSARHTQR
jgi:F0F1-type ATP synthase assembly protein I